MICEMCELREDGTPGNEIVWCEMCLVCHDCFEFTIDSLDCYLAQTPLRVLREEFCKTHYDQIETLRLLRRQIGTPTFPQKKHYLADLLYTLSVILLDNKVQGFGLNQGLWKSSLIDTLKDELQEGYFALFDIATKIHLMRGKDTPELEALKPILDDALSTISELMARLDETDEPLDIKTSQWLSSVHQLFG